jgi:hypothetical protein
MTFAHSLLVSSVSLASAFFFFLSNGDYKFALVSFMLDDVTC